jgi:hypothetical protein
MHGRALFSQGTGSRNSDTHLTGGEEEEEEDLFNKLSVTGGRALSH